MSDKLLKDGLRTSEKIGGVSTFAELLFVRLILATCYLGRCPWSPDWILTHALPNRPRTRPTAIAEALQALLSARLIARYHAPDGTAYLTIPRHGQRLKHAVRSQWPDPPGGPPDIEGQEVFGFSVPEEEEKRRGGKAREARQIPAPTPPVPAACPNPNAKLQMPNSKLSAIRHSAFAIPHSSESPEAWLERMQQKFPALDVVAQLKKAQAKRKGDVERGWFEAVWLPGCTAQAPKFSALNSQPSTSAAAPENWRTVLEEIYPENLINRENRGWSDVPESIRREIFAEMKRRQAA